LDEECPVWIDPVTGDIITVMCCDYGFRTGRWRRRHGGGGGGGGPAAW
jgi:hypothetical protein